MNESLSLLTAWVAGLALGMFFFGGLWWTIRKSVASDRPALLFLASLLVRMSIALAGFYFVGLGNWQRLMACLIGFVIARLLVTRLTRPAVEAAHAS